MFRIFFTVLINLAIMLQPFFSLRKELDQLRSLKATKLNDARQAEVEVESKKRHLEALKHQLQGLQKTKEEMRQSLEVAESRQAAVKSKVISPRPVFFAFQTNNQRTIVYTNRCEKSKSNSKHTGKKLKITLA